MKRLLIISILALLGMIQAVAQEYEYVPFVREGVKWVYGICNYNYNSEYPNNPALGDNLTYRTLELKGDTVINGKNYTAMHKYSGAAIDEENDTIPIYLREEDKVVYGIIPDGKLYYDCPVYNYFAQPVDIDFYSGEEFVLYDFQDPVYYWDGIFSNPYYQNNPIMGDYYYSLLSTDTIEVGNHMAKCYQGEIANVDFQMIEGIGWVSDNGSNTTLAFHLPVSNGYHAQCFRFLYMIEDGEIVYPQGYVNDRYQPVIQEDVKWVNERIIINNGITTNYYYAYEFKGNHPERDSYSQIYKALYYKYYTENGVGIGDESLIAGMREDESCILGFKNEALNSVINDDANLINFFSYYHNDDSRLMYGMSVFSDGMYVIDYYIANQREPFLNTENFVMVDPIVIDGVICSRCAYIGELGDTLAYVVEGIGFDSRDLGDLLTPFTRKPDPNAEYQEWCGLSHVVKNGQIIYKGMRYRDDVHVGIDEVVADKTRYTLNPNYYNLMGQPVGKDLPTTPGIYIHQGKKIVVR